MNYSEHAVLFPCNGESLVGVVAAPHEPRETAVVVIVGGPQYRAGSHRQFVLLARRLAESGYAVLRFDHRGMGDSCGVPRSFESLDEDIGCAIDALLAKVPQAKRVALWGLCDAASAALLYCHARPDARVTGLCLLNPWVRSDVSLARTHVKHYYAQRLMEREFWVKLMRGQLGVTALAGLISTAGVALSRAPQSESRQLPFQRRMVEAWKGFRRDILLLLSGADYTAKEFLEHASIDPAWADVLNHPRLQRCDLAGADHTFSDVADRRVVEDSTLAWLDRLNGR